MHDNGHVRALCCLLLVCGVAAAEPRIEVTGLGRRAIETIRIQLSDIDADLSISIEQASVGELVVRVESDHPTIVRAIEIPSGRADDVEHAIALKIADLVEQALAIKPLAITQQPAIEMPTSELYAIAVIDHPVVRDRDRLGFLAELGVDGLTGKTALHAAAGIAWRRDHVLLETVASLRGSPETEVSIATGRMSVADTTASVHTRTLASAGSTCRARRLTEEWVSRDRICLPHHRASTCVG